MQFFLGVGQGGPVVPGTNCGLGEASPTTTLGAGAEAGEGTVSFSIATTSCVLGLLWEAGCSHGKVWIHVT